MVLPRAQHMVTTSVAMILGQEGGPNSTSLSEALSIRRWSCSRRPSGLSPAFWKQPASGSCRRRRELSSNLLSELGGNASSLPAFGGTGTLFLDYFYFFSSGLFFVKVMALSLNYRFFRASDENGPICKMYLARCNSMTTPPRSSIC
jgi:hypothetical protein